MKINIVSPLEFVAIAEKMTMAEKHISMLMNVGIFHGGHWYDVPRDDAVTAVERREAIRRIYASKAEFTS